MDDDALDDPHAAPSDRPTSLAALFSLSSVQTSTATHTHFHPSIHLSLTTSPLSPWTAPLHRLPPRIFASIR